MTTRAIQLILCLVTLATVLACSGCRSADDTLPASPEAAPTAIQTVPSPSPVATSAPAATPAPAPALLFDTTIDDWMIAVWPVGQTAQPIAGGNLLYGQALSPDGRRVVIDTQRTGWQSHGVAILNLTDGSIEPLHLLADPYTVHWSPDGRLLLYEYWGESDSQLVVHDFASGDDTPILTMTTIFLTAGWSADSRQIAFVSNDDGQYDLYVLDVGTGVMRRLTNTVEVEIGVVWSPVDSTLLVGTAPYNEPVMREGYLINANRLQLIDDDGASQPLGNYEDVNAASLTWSPDGRQVAFSESGTLCTRALATSQTTCLLATTMPFGAYFAAFNDPPAWSPDGRWLAFRARNVYDSGCDAGVFAWEIETGEVHIVEERNCNTGPVYWVANWEGAP